MGDREEEPSGARVRGWLALGGPSRTRPVFWTAPTIRSFPARRAGEADVRRPDRDGRSPGGGTPR